MLNFFSETPLEETGTPNNPPKMPDPKIFIQIKKNWGHFMSFLSAYGMRH